MSDTKALRDLLAAATPGVWLGVDSSRGRKLVLVGGNVISECVVRCFDDDCDDAEFEAFDNATFIAAVHNALPALLDEVDALRAYKAAHERVLAEVEELPEDFKDGHAWIGAMNEGEIELRDALRAAEAEGGAS